MRLSFSIVGARLQLAAQWWDQLSRTRAGNAAVSCPRQSRNSRAYFRQALAWLLASETIAVRAVTTAIGRFTVTRNEADKDKFKMPSLRNVAVTAPYMHDGRFKTIEEVIEHYNSGASACPRTARKRWPPSSARSPMTSF